MLLTEQDAREKWCPFARVLQTAIALDESCQSGSVNRFTGADHECHCIASDCMAWRWQPEHQLETMFTQDKKPREGWEYIRENEPPKQEPFSELDAKLQAEDRPYVHEWRSIRSGHCGLAGRPEHYRGKG